jgi:inosine-uridine nucleoside N-ribohydrolase
MPQKILIDTDPGVDDAMAILFALRSPELEVLGLTSVFGNTYVDIAALNALRLVELEGNEKIPVAKGAGRPLLISPRSIGDFVHGKDGFGNSYLPPPSGELLDKPAAQFIVETVTRHPHEVTLVPVGPLTNIALALRLEPKIVDLVSQVVLMGGAAYVPGNSSPVAEANIVKDPHAAAIVFGAGWPLTMVGLDVTMKCVMTEKYLEVLGEVGNPATDLIKRILPFYQDYHDQAYGMGGDIHTHDPSAIAYLLNPGLFQTESMPVFVETEGHCAGQTVPDQGKTLLDSPLTNVCLDIYTSGLLDLYWERLTE